MRSAGFTGSNFSVSAKRPALIGFSYTVTCAGQANGAPFSVLT